MRGEADPRAAGVEVAEAEGLVNELAAARGEGVVLGLVAALADEAGALRGQLLLLLLALLFLFLLLRIGVRRRL